VQVHGPFYWIALLSPRDQWHARVLAFAATLDAYHLYTTDEVLTESLNLSEFVDGWNWCM